MTQGDSDARPKSDETLPANCDSASAPSIEPRRIRYVGDYELIAEIARGGMGIVYRAKQLSLNRIVAVKVIRRAEYATEVDRLRFRSEAKAAANLDHPNIVPIYEVGEHEDEPYFSMRLIEGGSLADSIRLGRWPIDKPNTARRATRLVAIVARAVHVAHQYGILHRDLKPGNILLDASETPFVTDFGLAKRVESEMPGFDNTNMTQTGEIIGTPAFMPPEQALGKKGLTTGADVYSLGAILYTLLAGRTPFQSDSPLDLMHQVVSMPAPSLRKLNAQVDLDLETICQKCLEKDPEKRYSSALSLAEDLDRWSRGEAIKARPVSLLERGSRWMNRNPARIGAVASIVGLLVLATILLGSIYLTTQSAYQALQRRDRVLATRNAFRELENNHQERFVKNLLDIERASKGSKVDRWERNYLRKKSSVEFMFSDEESAIIGAKWNSDATVLAVCRRQKSFNFLRPNTYRLDFWLWSGNSTSDTKRNTPLVPVDDRLLELKSKPPSLTINVKSEQNISWFAFDEAIALHPSQASIAICTDGDIQVWDYLAQKMQWRTVRPPCQRVNSMYWSHGGDRLAVIHDSREIAIHSPFAYGSGVVTTTLSPTLVQPSAWTIDDSSIAVSTFNETVFVNPIDGSVRARWPFPVTSWSPDGSRWVTNKGIGDYQSPEVIIAGVFNENVVWSPDGKRIAHWERAIGPVAKEIQILNSETTETISKINASGSIRGLIHLFTDSDRLMFSDERSLRFLRPNPLSLTDMSFEVSGKINAIRASPSGRDIAISVGESPNRLEVWNELGERKFSLESGDGPSLSIAWQPDGQRIATLDRQGSVSLWDPLTGQKSDTIQMPLTKPDPLIEASFWRIDWSPSGDYLAASAAGDTIVIWNSRTLQQVHRWPKKRSRLIGWFHSVDNREDKSDDKLVIEACRGGTMSTQFYLELPESVNEFCHVQIWDAKSGISTYQTGMNLHYSNVSPVTISLDNQKFIAKTPYSVGITEVLTKQSSGFEYSERQNFETPFIPTVLEPTIDNRIIIGGSGKPVTLLNESDGQMLMELQPTSAKWTSMEQGKLWVATDTGITLLDGSPVSGNISMPLPGLGWYSIVPFACECIAITILFCIPLAVLFDSTIRPRAILARFGMAGASFGFGIALTLAGLQWAPYEAKVYWQLLEFPRIFLCCWWAFGFIWPTIKLAYLKRWASLTTYLAMCVGAGALLLLFNSVFLDDKKISGLSNPDLLSLLTIVLIPTLGLKSYFKERRVRKSAKMDHFLEFHRAPSWVRFGCDTTTAGTIALLIPVLVLEVPLGWLVFGVSLPFFSRNALFLLFVINSANLIAIVLSSTWMLLHCRSTGLPWKTPD